ncbi:HMG2-induced ER-remodeling protein 1 [Ceratocystis fimbriata CBS 114723]|uniref:HMG2-induced ER-remodeling protein 1 n=1 Tax=Ceratocystis fimbriata CBS 114723 TaxID=1035309 RepID=A0A2C5WW38_9PEZI|nr:HMG2-induced ER-remodeling protein 1 [Ceratocystis fimbriata CBS 114723]
MDPQSRPLDVSWMARGASQDYKSNTRKALPTVAVATTPTATDQPLPSSTTAAFAPNTVSDSVDPLLVPPLPAPPHISPLPQPQTQSNGHSNNHHHSHFHLYNGHSSLPATPTSPARPSPTAAFTTTATTSAIATATAAATPAAASALRPVSSAELAPQCPPPPSPSPSSSRSLSRRNSTTSRDGSGGLGLRRTSSWFSNFSSKFSSSAAASANAAANTNLEKSPARTTVSSVSGAESNGPPTPTFNSAAARLTDKKSGDKKTADKKNAILPAASKHQGDAPYTPAPVKPTQAGLMGVLRRISQSSNFMSTARGGNNHGLVERKVLNIDTRRQRCNIADLHQGKLRRVAFCVDVEVAPMPKYLAANGASPPPPPAKTQSQFTGPPTPVKDSLSDKAEGEVFKKAANTAAPTSEKPEALPPALEAEVNKANLIQTANETLGSPQLEPQSQPKDISSVQSSATTCTAEEEAAKDKKREKKKRTEEERRARREKKRRIAEANGQVPMEIHIAADSSSEEDSSALSTSVQSTDTVSTSPPSATAPPVAGSNSTDIANPATNSTPSSLEQNSTSPVIPPATKPAKANNHPTTNPVRIYRRCCQLRETPILKRITEQLMNPENCNATTGVIEKLDFTGFYLQFPDFVALGDYFAVVPVKEVIFENCGLNDESLRMVLAGLLAVRLQDPRRKHLYYSAGAIQQGGVVERLVVANNKIGPEGWKHICLFIYMCRTLQQLDVSHLKFPKPIYQVTAASSSTPKALARTDMSMLLARSIKERLAGPQLELLNFGATQITAQQLSNVIDGALQCGVKRLGLANNNLDADFIPHINRFLASPVSDGLDLGSNDLRDHIEAIAAAIVPGNTLCALSLANCNLEPKSLYKILPALVPLPDFKFLDLSSNTALFTSEPTALPAIRRYLPKMESIKRIHLANVAMKAEHAIMIAEILPEVPGLAHLVLLNNPALEALSDARTESDQEEACALYASLLAATKFSDSLVCIDIEVPSENTSEVVRAIAQQVVAYCLRNLAQVTMSEAAPGATPKVGAVAEPEKLRNPDVLAHLVGRMSTKDDYDDDDDVSGSDNGEAPDDDYVIGGTGVVKALQACLNCRLEDGSRPSGELPRDADDEICAGKARDVAKHLLSSARKIRARLQPALASAKDNNSHDVRRLLFLNRTLNGIISRFEDEYPETRRATTLPLDHTRNNKAEPAANLAQPPSPTTTPVEPLSDNENDDDTTLHVPTLSRSSSVMFQSSKDLADEEGRMLRAGNRLREGLAYHERHEALKRSMEAIRAEPRYEQLLVQMITDIDDAELNAKVAEIGLLPTFIAERERIIRLCIEREPEHWYRFIESQEKACANTKTTTAMTLEAVSDSLQLLLTPTTSGGSVSVGDE